MNALINSCLKPTPSTLPLATNEIKKLHHWNFYLKAERCGERIVVNSLRRRESIFMGSSHHGNQARIYGPTVGILPNYGHVLAS
jgi:hypothetical protein